MSKEFIAYEYKVYPRFEDTDAYGVIHHSRYLVYAEEAKFAFMKDLVFFDLDIVDQKEKFLVTEVQLKYINAVRYSSNMPLSIKLKFNIEQEIKIKFEFVIYNEKVVVCKGYSIHVVVDDENKLKFTLPKGLINQYNKLVDKEGI